MLFDFNSAQGLMEEYTNDWVYEALKEHLRKSGEVYSDEDRQLEKVRGLKPGETLTINVSAADTILFDLIHEGSGYVEGDA